MRIASVVTTIAVSILLGAGPTSAEQRLFFVEQPVRSHASGSLAAYLSCAGVLRSTAMLYDQGASEFADGYTRDELDRFSLDLTEGAITAFFQETGFSQDHAKKNRLAYSVLGKGVIQQVLWFSGAYNKNLVPSYKLLPGPDADPAETQADVTHCIQLHEARK